MNKINSMYIDENLIKVLHYNLPYGYYIYQNKPDFKIKINDEYFNIHWLVDLFENFKFYDVIIDNSNKITHWQVNTNKKKIIKQNINTEYIKSLSVNWFMVGKLNPQNKTKLSIKSTVSRKIALIFDTFYAKIFNNR